MSKTRATGFQGYHQSLTGAVDEELTVVDRGTPCGEFMRRYWQPVSMSSELGELPMVVELLGEQLVLFRDKSGQTGLLHRHCAHRGASLEYGIIADKGIICCYHGWHYDVDGRLISAGSEWAESPVCNKVVQGAYPTHEFEGIIFAYLGPPEHIPPFPTYDVSFVDDTKAIPFSIDTPCNWLQVYENTQDPIHVLHLHARSSGVQFGVASGVDQTIEYMDTPLGMMNIQTRQIENNVWIRTTESIFPNGNQTGAIWEEASEEKYFQRTATLRWMVPCSNTLTRTIGWRYFRPELDPQDMADENAVGKESIDFIGQTEDERPYAERQRQPGDYEAQVSQRPIAIHALEHHASSDAGVVRIRHMLRKRVRALQESGTVEHPVQHERPINTFTQDTVIPSDIVMQENDRRILGRHIAETIVASWHESPEQRQQQVQDACTKLTRGNWIFRN